MEEIKRDKVQRDYHLIRILGLTVLALLMLMSIVGAAPFAYVTNSNGTVSVIDTTTNTVTASAPAGMSPIGVAISPDGTKVYVTHPGSYTVS